MQITCLGASHVTRLGTAHITGWERNTDRLRAAALYRAACCT